MEAWFVADWSGDWTQPALYQHKSEVGAAFAEILYRQCNARGDTWRKVSSWVRPTTLRIEPQREIKDERRTLSERSLGAKFTGYVTPDSLNLSEAEPLFSSCRNARVFKSLHLSLTFKFLTNPIQTRHSVPIELLNPNTIRFTEFKIRTPGSDCRIPRVELRKRKAKLRFYRRTRTS
jgi:hypothetical protein